MKIHWLFIALVAVSVLVALAIWARAAFAADMQRTSGESTASLYDLQTRSLFDEPVDLGQYRGQVALVVNTASKCGLTPQYAGLETLHRELAEQGFTVLGFPSNDFLNQEPGTPEEIREFCDANFQVTFPLFAKVQVKGGQKDPVYQLLCEELEEPSWNFTKYVVDRQGLVVARFGPRTAPDNPRLRDTIMRALAAE
jgi:glutathione peroxidase